jgi:hypothetical protein
MALYYEIQAQPNHEQSNGLQILGGEIDLPSRHIILMIALLVLIYSVLCVHFGDCGCANFFVLVYLSHFFSCDIRAKHDN